MMSQSFPPPPQQSAAVGSAMSPAFPGSVHQLQSVQRPPAAYSSPMQVTDGYAQAYSSPVGANQGMQGPVSGAYAPATQSPGFAPGPVSYSAMAPASAGAAAGYDVSCIPAEMLHGAHLRDPVTGWDNCAPAAQRSAPVTSCDPCAAFGGGTVLGRPSELAQVNNERIAELQNELTRKMREIEAQNQRDAPSSPPPLSPQNLSTNELRLMELRRALGNGGQYSSTDSSTFGVSCNPSSVAQKLYQAMKGFGTNEDAVWRALSEIQSQADWDAVCATFRRQHPDMKGGFLQTALESDLTADELLRAKGILSAKGVQWNSSGGAMGANNQSGGAGYQSSGLPVASWSASAPTSGRFGPAGGTGYGHQPAASYGQAPGDRYGSSAMPVSSSQRIGLPKTGGVTPEQLGYETAVRSSKRVGSPLRSATSLDSAFGRTY